MTRTLQTLWTVVEVRVQDPEDRTALHELFQLADEALQAERASFADGWREGWRRALFD
jgi:hypothetical protein